MSVLEAQAAGAVPVVVRGPHTAATGLVTDGVNGLVCDPSPAALATAISELLAKEALRGRMALAARHAAMRYDWDVIATEIGGDLWLAGAGSVNGCGGEAGMSSSTVATRAVARRSTAVTRRPRLPVGLIAGAVVAGSAGVLATSSLGSGDYGQWLMAARPYLGEGIPAYRAGNAVPPVVPAFIAAVARVVPNGAAAIHIAAVLLLIALATAAYLAGAVLFRSRLAGVLAVVGTFLLTDLYFDLFAFGGLLQAGGHRLDAFCRRRVRRRSTAPSAWLECST